MALQLAALVLTAAGWGYWLSRLCGSGWQTAAAALCAGWLVLQDLLPLGVRLSQSSWWAAAVAGTGIVAWSVRNIRPGPARQAVCSLPRLGTGTGIFLAVFAFQAAGLVFWGTRDYYGYGRQDQVNYTETAEFLIEKPFGMRRDQVQLEPWAVKGIDTKYDRIGQCVAQGYLAVITGTDASRSYGTISTFFVALAALAVFSALEAFGVSPLLAAAGGLWSGLLPALTQTQLDGFYSQTATLFCFPFLAALAAPPAPSRWRQLVCPTLILTFLLASYSEEYVLGAALVLATAVLPPSRNNLSPSEPSRNSLSPSEAARGSSLSPSRSSLTPSEARRYNLSPSIRLAGAAGVVIVPWVLLAPFAAHLWGFIASQYRSNQASPVLTVWQPEAGSWLGWAHLFVPGHGALAVIAGIALLGFAVRGALLRPANLAMFLVPAAVLGVLGMMVRPFPQYAFGKLTVSFAPLIVMLVVLGLSRLRLIAAPLLAAGIVAAAAASWPKMEKVFRNQEGLPTANWPPARLVYRQLDAHPERTYLITEPHGLLNSWLAYHARHARTYSAVPIGDAYMDPAYPFLRPPPPDQPYWVVRGAGLTFVPAAKRN